MVDTLHPANAVAGAPAYNGRMLRQVAAVGFAGATTARPLGARSGVRPGTPAGTVTATSTTWTCRPVAGVADVMTAAEAGVYEFSCDANATGAVAAAHATLPRKDIIYISVTDPAESVGATVSVTRKYLAGAAAASPSAPAIPGTERGFVLAELNVPASGGGAPSVSWVAPTAVSAGGVTPLRSGEAYPSNPSVGMVVARPSGPALPAGLDTWDGSGWRAVNSGLTLITTAQIAAGSTELILDNIFSGASFDNYLVQLDIEATASRNLQAQLRAGGATKTSSYWTQVFYGGGGSAAAAAQANVAQWQLTGVAGQIHGIDLKVRRPSDPAWRTMALTEGTATDLGGPSLGKNENGHWYGTSEAHDGLRISLVAASGATFKGTVAVYGCYKG